MQSSQLESDHRRGQQRRGAILVVVCAGLGVLLLFASLAVDVGFWFLTRNRLNAMSQAAANAGYELLKEKDFLYHDNKAEIHAAIRAYLEYNGATSAEAAAATISVNRRGQIEVSMDRDAPVFFSSLGGLKAQAVAGSGVLLGNNVAPFGVPTTYQDQNQDGMPNWVPADETIDTAIQPWEWKKDKPYIVKFGEGNRTGLDKHLVFIPMDDQAHSVKLPDGSFFTLPAQDMKGTVTWFGDQDKATRDANPGTDIGVLRAYGIAYDVLGLPPIDTNGDGKIDETDEKPPVQWVLGYDGGAFTIAEDALARAGYVVDGASPDGNGTYIGTLKHSSDGNTHVKAVQLKVNVINDPTNVRPKDVAFVEFLGDLMDAGLIQALSIDYQPQIATFTEYEDPVTSTMINAGIPFTAFFLDEGLSVYHSFGVNPATEDSTSILNKLDTHGPFDWLHLHHENFIQKLNGIYAKSYVFEELCEGQVYDTSGNYHFVENRAIYDTDGDGTPDTTLDLNEDGDTDDVFFFEDHSTLSQYQISPPVNVNDVWSDLNAAIPYPPKLIERCKSLGMSSCTQTYDRRLRDINRDGVIGKDTDGNPGDNGVNEGEVCFGKAMRGSNGVFVDACENRKYSTNPNYHLWEDRLDMDGDGVAEGFDINLDGDTNDIFFAEDHTSSSQMKTYGGWRSLALHLNYRERIPFVTSSGGNWKALDFNGDGIIGTDWDSDGNPDIDIDGDGNPDAKACFGKAMRTSTFSGQHYIDKENLVYAFWRHVAERDGFLFAACWATDTLDSALARLGSPDFVFSDSSNYNSSTYLFTGAKVPQGSNTVRKSKNKPLLKEGGTLRYDYTFAFQDFYLREGSTYMGSQSSYIKEISEIEYGESSTQFYLIDYLNPLLQSHMGFLGIDLDEGSSTMGAPSSSDYLIKQGGATDAFRHEGINISGHAKPDIVKPHIWPTGGNTIPYDEAKGGIPGGKVMMLAQKRDNSVRRMETKKSLPMVYLSGVAFDVQPDGADNGFGRWSYLGGHGPARGNGKSSFGKGYKYRFACEGEEYSYNDEFMETTSFVDINLDGDIKDIKALKYLGKPLVLPGSKSTKRELGDLDGDGKIGNDDGSEKCFNMSLRYSVQTNALEGMRLYLNNILFGATVKGQGGKIPNSGAINPAGKDLGDGPGGYGNVGFAANNFATMFKLGVKKMGLPIGAQFRTAPGDFKGQVENSTNYLFKDGQGNRDSITWKQFQKLSPETREEHKQVTAVAVIERIPEAAEVPTPKESLSEFMGANSDRDKSIYGGRTDIPNTDPSQARDVHVIGFARFFLIDPANQDPVTQDSTKPADFVAQKWRDGEIRGYLLDFLKEPADHQIYPKNPQPDPR